MIHSNLDQTVKQYTVLFSVPLKAQIWEEKLHTYMSSKEKENPTMDYYTYFCFNLALVVLMDEFSISKHRFFFLQMSIYLEIFTNSYIKSQGIGKRFSGFAEKAAPGLRHCFSIINGRVLESCYCGNLTLAMSA